VALLAEYDALPDIGHGCGHNLIAISNLGAGLGAKAAMESLGGRLIVLGTPAEEGGGGKIRMLDAGVFEGVDVAFSSHPASNLTAIPTDIPVDESWSLAMVGYRYAFHGKAAHAAAAAHEGINALNAVIHLFTGIAPCASTCGRTSASTASLPTAVKRPTWCQISRRPTSCSAPGTRIIFTKSWKRSVR